jgi:gamma-glutamyltranspeptidase / glutathione hydrolase
MSDLTIRKGLVAAAHPDAMAAGQNILDGGGNALEAAVVTAACLAVVEPYASGLGGGGFMVAHLARPGETFVLDSRVTAPQSAKSNMFENVESEAIDSGGLPVGVPGAVRHWAEALQRSRTLLNGSLTLATALKPAIRLASEGFRVSETFESIGQAPNTNARLKLFPETERLFANLHRGDRLVQPELARTLQLISAHGPATFYEGPVARAIVETVRNPPAKSDSGVLSGGMTAEDLTGYQVRERAPLRSSYRSRGTNEIYHLLTAGPPAGGLSVLEMMNILEDLPVETDGGELVPQSIHLMIECMKLAYADRVFYVGDPEAVRVPAAGLISKGFAAERRKRIDPNSQIPLPAGHGDVTPFEDARFSAATGEPCESWITEDDISTTHLSVVDRWGNMVSYTTSLSAMFGSAMVVPGFGFLLNDSLRDFNVKGTGPNAPGPGKRPKSGMSPMLVFDENGEERAVVGAAGGNRIPAIVYTILVRMLEANQCVSDAIAAARFVNESRRTGVGVSDTRVEQLVAAEVVEFLRARGQTVHVNTKDFGAAQGLDIKNHGSVVEKGTDPRRTSEI